MSNIKAQIDSLVTLAWDKLDADAFAESLALHIHCKFVLRQYQHTNVTLYNKKLKCLVIAVGLCGWILVNSCTAA